MKKIEGIIQNITNTCLKGDGHYIAALILDWPKVVGAQLSTIVRPEKIVFPRKRNLKDPEPGTLHLQVSHSAYAFELSYQQDLLLERINGFFGRLLVARISFKHGSRTFKATELEEQPFLVEDKKISPSILRAVSQISDPELQKALLSLARNL